jgi:hypothetical protein
MKQHEKDIEVLLLGSSHVYFGVNPDLFDSHCFNLAHIAQTPEFDLKLFQKYYPQLTNLKVLLYPISYFTLFWDLQSSTESWRLKNYTIYYQLDVARTVNDHAEMLSIKPKLNYQRIIDYYKNNRSEIGVTPKGWGYNCLAQYSQNLEESAPVAAQRHTLPTHQFYPKNSNEVDQLLQLCKQQGIKVILFFPPASEPYRKLVDPKQLQMTYQKIDTFLNKYTNCTFLDFYTDTSFIRQDFLDADHLNDQGAIKLSQKLNEIISKLANS